MCRKLIYMVSFVLALSLAGSAQAGDIDWTNAGGSGLWNDALNWSESRVPVYGEDDPVIRTVPGPIVQAPGMGAFNIWMTDTSDLTIDGGGLSVSNDLYVSDWGGAVSSILTVNSGTLKVDGTTHVAYHVNGTLNMNGGTFTANNFNVATEGGSTGHVNLDGGVITCATFLMGAGAATMDIEAGTLIIDGDARSTVQGYIDDGWITAYDGSDEVLYDYNVTNAGKTTVWAESPVFTQAKKPSPKDGATGVPIDVTLSWTPGMYADKHDVYFGTDLDDVNNANNLDPIGPDKVYRAHQDANSYPVPETLDLGQTYYWRIDEVNVAGPDPCMWKGRVWSFTTIDYLVVDDMEGYTDRMGIITVWRDGYTALPVGTTGSNVTVSTESDNRDPRLAGDGPPWPVRDSEAMQFAYDNDGSITIYLPGWLPYPYSVDANYYSEAKAAIAHLPIDPNWTEEGVKALTLWFYGDADNDIEPMWVKLTDQGGSSGKVTYGDYGENPNDIDDPSWHEWNIALSDFGVDLAHINDISIGFGDENNRTTPGGSGVVFFDDIRLYPTRCISRPDIAEGNLNGDCVIDFKDFAILADGWLKSGIFP